MTAGIGIKLVDEPPGTVDESEANVNDDTRIKARKNRIVTFLGEARENQSSS
jgi:hypothetical protein